MQKSMRAGVEGSGTVNFDIPPRGFNVTSLIAFNFQHFLTLTLRHSPNIIGLIPLEFLVQIRHY